MSEVEAILLTAIGSGLLLSFVSYVPESPSLNHVGPLGYHVSDLLIQAFGYAAYIFPSLLIVAGAVLFGSRRARISAVRTVGGVCTLLLAAVALGLYRPHVAPEVAGGWVGGFLATVLEDAVGRGGAAVLLVASSLLVFIMVTGKTLGDVATMLVAAFQNLSAQAVEQGRAGAKALGRTLVELKGRLPELRRHGKPKAATWDDGEAPPVVYGADEDDEVAAPAAEKSEESKIRVELPSRTAKRASKKATKSKAEQEEFVFDIDTSDFRLPPTSLIGPHDDRTDYVDESTLVSQSKVLEQKLATFGVNGRVTAVRPGPVITTYEFEPESGVKVSRVVNLCDDLTMALRAHGVRIVAPIPGKNVVGIEVSNRKRATVGLRDLLEDDEFHEVRSPLTLAVGRDTTGGAAYADLARMPHLLMAGATGTGKSVALNSYIISLLYKCSPRDVRFIMIDPKMLELSLYEGIPHLLVPVVTDVKKASAALLNAVREMDRRFELLKDKKVRNLDDYNRRIAEEAKEAKKAPKAAADDDDGVVSPDRGDSGGVDGAEPLVHEHLPRLVVIVDELADLMMSVGREVEEAITRLAQKARAAGIHLIIATQRPSVDVITGLIKANFPSRISFQVTSRPDSRTILDTVGADRLLGNGDLLYMAPGTSFLQRRHGAFISDREIKGIVEFLRGQGDPEYRMEMLEAPTAGADLDGDEEFFDELYDRAVDVVTQHGQGSTSWLQRKLGIGYNRAARIMEHMEREGVVGPADGAKPRKVLAQAIGE